MSEKTSFEIEYLVRSSPKILFNFLGSATGLGDWFADAVVEKDNQYTFTWNGYSESARIVGIKDNEFVSFEWVDGEREGCTFEMRVKLDELTGGVALLVTDETEDPEEVDDLRRLWDAQVANLLKILGS
jgi:uncharacterized protein YndB with AHSA1/START domain